MLWLFSVLSAKAPLILSFFLFTLGLVGLSMNRRNAIRSLLCIELMLLAALMNFVTFSASNVDVNGQIFGMFIIAVAAAESAIGLAIILAHYRNKGSIELTRLNNLKEEAEQL